MSNGWLAGQIAKTLTNKRRSRSFWNVFFASMIMIFLVISLFFGYKIYTGSSAEVAPAIFALVILICPFLGFFIFMLIVTNIKKPSKRIEKIQRKYLLRFYK